MRRDALDPKDQRAVENETAHALDRKDLASRMRRDALDPKDQRAVKNETAHALDPKDLGE